MVLGDIQFTVLRAALVAVQSGSGEEQNRDIQQQHSGHADQDGDVGHIPQNTDETQCEREDDHDRCDLRKGLVSKEILAAADDASSKLAAIVEASFPVQKDLFIAVDRGGSCRLLVRIDLDLAQSAAAFLSYDNSHVVDVMGVREFLEVGLPFSRGRGGIVPG